MNLDHQWLLRKQKEKHVDLMGVLRDRVHSPYKLTLRHIPDANYSSKSNYQFANNTKDRRPWKNNYHGDAICKIRLGK